MSIEEDTKVLSPSEIKDYVDSQIQDEVQRPQHLYSLTNKIGEWFVVASDPTEAVKKLDKVLQDNSYGFTNDRTVTIIEIIGNEIQGCPTQDTNLIL